MATLLLLLALTLTLVTGCGEGAVLDSELVAYRGLPALNEKAAAEGRFLLGEKAAGFRWQSYVSVADAGYSATELAEAQSYFEKLGGAAALVVVDGKILANLSVQDHGKGYGPLWFALFGRRLVAWRKGDPGRVD